MIEAIHQRLKAGGIAWAGQDVEIQGDTNVEPMPLLEQSDALRVYTRTLRADVNRCNREALSCSRKRRVSPFVEHLRYRRVRNGTK